MKLKCFLLVLVLAFVAGCQESEYFDSNMTYMLVSNDGQLANSIKLELKDTVEAGSVLVARFESPEDEQVVEHVISEEDIKNKVVFLETKMMDNWGKWHYMIEVDVYTDSTKQIKIETYEQNTVIQPYMRNAIKKLKSIRMPKERVSFEIDGHKWHRGYEDGNSKMYLAEYVFGNETVENWSELITYQVAYDIQKITTLKQFMDDVHSGVVADDCRGLVWNVAVESPDRIIYEWHHDGCVKWSKQYEMAVLLHNDEGIHSLRYTIKGNELDAEKRQILLDSMEKANF